MKLSSCAFPNNGEIPVRHTGFGEDLSPELIIDSIPGGTASIAIILDDLDIPIRGELCHWLIWNIAPAERIPEGLPHGKSIDAPISAVQGKAWGRHRYRGPKQPPFIRRAHTYRFKAYALDTKLDISPASDKKALLNAMRGHIIETAELLGSYAP